MLEALLAGNLVLNIVQASEAGKSVIELCSPTKCHRLVVTDAQLRAGYEAIARWALERVEE